MPWEALCPSDSYKLLSRHKLFIMKIFYLIATVFLLTFIGCSSTYKVSDFSSKDKFYEDFNSFARNKNMKVTLTDDSSFITNEGTMISNDSLILLYHYQKEVTNTIPQSEIRNIRDIYDANSNHIIKILLKDGREFSEKDVKYLPDSSIQFTTNKTLSINKSIPLSNVKEAYYKKHWPGIIPGIISGFLISFVIAELGDAFSTHVDSGIFATGAANVEGVPVGTIAGGVIGWFIGYAYTYQFNP